MGLSSALTTSLNGLTLNEQTIDVLGNNIANAETTGFKSSQVQFSTQLAQTLSYGSAPTATDGGTDPLQIGLGATTAQISTDFSQGSIASSSSPSDLAIQGDGFFVVNSKDGNVYTRNGSFRLDSGNKLSTGQGQRLMGYSVDANFNLVTTQLSSISIPLGNLHLAQQTTDAKIGGALSPQGAVGTHGTLQTSEALTEVNPPAANAPATSSSLLTNVYRAADTATPLYSAGDVIKFSPTKGGRTLDTKSMTVTATTTMSDFMTFINDTLGLQTPTSNPAIPTDADGIAVGASMDASGDLLVKGNRGTVNDFDIPVGSLTVNGAVVPISFTPSASRADGESTSTAFSVYDSLGTALTVRMSAVMESQTANKTTYRYFLESADQSGPNIVIGSGTVDFNNQGQVINPVPQQFSINRSSTAAVNPMLFGLDVSGVSGISSTGSNLNLTSQDGTNPGTLTSYVIDGSGKINGAFDNGIIRTLGQIVLARFSNPSGLLQNGNDTYKQGISSGLPQLSAPGQFGSGTIRAGAIELSNTDIGKNLVDLITASTNYRGNARVISAIDQLVNELLLLGRQ